MRAFLFEQKSRESRKLWEETAIFGKTAVVGW